MKKTLIALTLATLPVAASADVVLYGIIKGGVEVNRNFDVKDDAGNKIKQGTSTKIVDYGSRIGFKGHEDLSSNLRAIWQVEQNAGIGGNASNSFGNRDSFIGLTGGFGTVKAGNLSTPTKDVNARLDQWEYSSSAAGLGTYTRENEAVKRAAAISYETPNFNGFKAQAYVSPSDNNNGNSNSLESNNKERDNALYGAKLAYENAGFFAEAAGTYVKNTAIDLNGKTHDGYQAAANVGYDNGNWLAGVGYQQARYVDNFSTLTGQAVDGSVTDATTGNTTTYMSGIKRAQEVAASAAYNVNNNLRLKGTAAYGFGIKGFESEVVTDATGAVVSAEGGELEKMKYVQGILGADYLMSKRTSINGQVGYKQWTQGSGNDKSKVKHGTVGVGMMHKF